MYGNKNNKVKSKSMKKFTLFIALILTAVFGVKTTASAQTYETEEQIEWIKYAVDLTTAMNEPNGIYLCHWDGNKTYKFVTAGGTYGTQAIATTRGIKMTISNSYDNSYTFTCTLNNPNYGSCLGAEPSDGTTSRNVYLDRGRGQGDRYFYWNITDFGEFPYDQGKSAPYYHLINKNSNARNGRYVTVSNNNNTLQLTESDNDRWLFIPRDAFRNVLLAVTHQTNIEVSGLFQNTRFVRYMDEGASWDWYTIDKDTQTALDKIDENGLSSDNGTGLGLSEYGAYRSMAPGAENVKSSSLDYAKKYGNFSSAEIKKPLIMRQTATKVKVGTYTITAQAFVSKGADESSSTSAYLFASGATGQNAAAQISELPTEEQTNFNSFYSNHQNMLTGNNAKYFRGNVAAGEFLATNNGKILIDKAIYEPNTEFHSISISVTVAPNKDYTPDADGTQYGDLIIGIAKYSDVGTVYARNIRVYYSGTNEFGIDSYSTNNASFSAAFTEDGGIDNENSNIGGIDEYQYGYARQFNLVRDFGDTSGNKVTNPKWEALVLPVNLTVSQVKNAFGDDVQLSELVGLADNGHQIRFKTVNLNNTNEIAIKAGGCYVIKVTKAPEVGRDDEYTFDIYNSTFGDYKVPMTYYGPIYQIDGVTREYALTELINKNHTGSYANGVVTKEYKTDDGILNFTGYFYWNPDGVNNAYVVSRGKMFYLTTPWKNLTGTMWKLEDDNNGGAKELSVDFGDGDITNGISNITVEGENNVNATGIYNLNGQKVSDGTSTETLSKGIYIVNGKKYVVR